MRKMIMRKEFTQLNLEIVHFVIFLSKLNGIGLITSKLSIEDHIFVYFAKNSFVIKMFSLII